MEDYDTEDYEDYDEAQWHVKLKEETKTMLNSAKLTKQFWGEAANTACYTQNRSIIGKRHGKTTYDMFRGRSPVSATSMCLVPKAFRVFNIRRQEMEKTYHVTFREDDEAISQSSTEGDAINFNEYRFFPDDEFFEPTNKVTQCSGNFEECALIGDKFARTLVCGGSFIWTLISTTRSGHSVTWPISYMAMHELCKNVVDRSQGQLVDITIIGFCDDELLEYVADRPSQLRRLEIGFSIYAINHLTKALKKFPLLE
nr:F-box domain, leucine-rich repeat domain, L domain-like protein [Tanacetum cinerariifolium]